MTQKDETKKRRKRGVILTPQGLEKLHQAKADAEFEDNVGKRYTLEDLSERTALAVDTLMKVFACETAVDKQTLKICFSAFKLTLNASDYEFPETPTDDIGTLEESEPELPEGQVALDSVFYLERPPIEAECYKAILQPGALIRIKAPRRTGKTSLMARILEQAAQHNYRSVSISFQLAERAIFANLDKFLRWFCANISLGVQLPNRLADYWDELFGSKTSCKIYFEQYLLAATEQPLVLGLDDVDRLFQYPELADDFFGLLRTWHEEAKNRDIWKRLRLVVAHSTEVYIPLNVNQSPFNVGLPIELPEFSQKQVRELARRYGLNWSEAEAQQLMSLVGGHPYLVRLALYHLWHQDVTLEELEQFSTPATIGIYGDHLQRQLLNLQKDAELVPALTQLITASKPAELDLIKGFKLQSMGLVRLQGNQATPSCRLYAQYFQEHFSK